jgi:hypothetical protein
MKEYIPTSIRPPTPLPREEQWAIGIEHSRGCFGMTEGPFKTELEALEIVGQAKSRIIHFLPDGADVICWWWAGDRWIQRPKSNLHYL